MAIKRGDLVDAAKDLNKVLDLDPAIDVSKSVEEIRRDLEEASRLLSEDDALEDNTRAVVAALRGKEEVEKVDAPAEKKAKGGGRPKGSKNKEKGAAAAAAPKKAAGAPRGKATRLTDEDVSKVIRSAVYEDIREFTTVGADKLLKELRGRDEFSCSRERFHPLYRMIVEGLASA